MKRENWNAENKRLGLKKVKFFNEIDEDFIDLDKSDGEEERVLAENVAEGDGNRNLNFDRISGNEEGKEGSPLDLNLPAYSKYPNRWKNGLLQSDQYPWRPHLLESNKRPMDEEIVDLVSDDDETEVEIKRYTHGYNSNGKQMESVMHSDRVGNLKLGLGLLSMDNGDNENNLVTSAEWRYTREEKGKARDMTSWLSLKSNPFIDLDTETDSDEASQSVEVMPDEAAALAVRAEMDRAAEERDVAVRAEMDRAVRERDAAGRREAARQLARTNFSDQNSEIQSSSQKQQKPTPNPLKHLGNLPGPFSEALKMVRERASKGASQQLIDWRNLVKKPEQSITGPFVPSLLNLSLKALARSAEGVMSLQQVPDSFRGRLTNILCDIGYINASFLNLLVEGCPTEIRIKNCSWLTEEQFLQTIGKCRTKDLRVLQLDLCGQCMLDIAFTNILDRCPSSFSRLAIVSLRGACRLTDNGLRILVVSAPLLLSINLSHCTLLTSDAVTHIADILGSELRELYIDECHKIDTLQILPAFKKFRHLEVLSVAGIHTINDQFVSEIVTSCSQSIKELDFADCFQLTDCSLKTIGTTCTHLCSLNISNLNKLTDLGLEYLANGCRSIQKLKLRRSEFSDEAVAAFLESSGKSLLELSLNYIAKVAPLTALSLAKCSRKLLSLDISWCRKINDEALGLIVDSCSSLKLLKIFGCRQITNEFLEGHSNQRVRIVGSDLTPIMDHLDLLEAEEMFLQYSPLPDDIEG